MKKFLIILMGIVFLIGGGAAGAINGNPMPSPAPSENKPEGAKCPITTYTDQEKCADCHEMRKEDGKWGWRIKPQEAKDPKRLFRRPLWIKIVDGKAEGHYMLDGISSSGFTTFCDYMYEINMKKATIDIYSGGGALFGGVSIASQILKLQDRGIEVTTQIHSFAASAALVIFLAGNKRLTNSYAILMWHELQTIEWPKWATPSDKEDEARVFRLIQNNMNRYMADRIGTIDKDEIDKLVHRIEWWMTGQEAVESGIATGYIK